MPSVTTPGNCRRTWGQFDLTDERMNSTKIWEPMQHQLSEKTSPQKLQEFQSHFSLIIYVCMACRHQKKGILEIWSGRQDKPCPWTLFSQRQSSIWLDFLLPSPPRANKVRYRTETVPRDIIHLLESFCASILYRSFTMQRRCQQDAIARWFK